MTELLATAPVVGHLDLPTFTTVVAASPLVSMDLVLVRDQREVLLGLRSNRPAQGYWFVPGGRIYKSERMQAALQRIAQTELGLGDALGRGQVRPQWLGSYEHFYDDSFSGQPGVSTHYVVLAHVLHVPAGFEPPSRDAQHQDWRWWPLAEAARSEQVHRFSRDYLTGDLPSPR